MALGLVNLILVAICIASLTFMSVVYMHHSSTEQDHSNHKDAKSISHPLLEQYNILSESVAQKREELRNSYLQALQNRGNSPDRDGLDSKVDVESPRNFLKPSDTSSKSSTAANVGETSSLASASLASHVVAAGAHPGDYDLPGAKDDHRILTLSDEMFESTPISEMMSWYGEASGKEQCANDFGNGLVRRWRKNRTPYCRANKPITFPKSGVTINPSVDCFPTKQYRHGGLNDNLCIMNDVSMNVGIFGDQNRAESVISSYVSSGHMDMPYIHYPKGFLKSTCSPNKDHWDAKYLPGWNADLTVKAMELIPSSNSPESIEQAYACSEWVEHNVLLIQRDTFANFFHDSEDFVNTFLALAVLEWKRGDTQIVITDLFPEGPFWDIWSKVYSPAFGREPDIAKRKVVTAWDLSQKYGPAAAASGGSSRNRICFRRAAVGIFGPAAPIAVASWNTFCSRTALVRAYADFVIRGLQLQSESHYAKAAPEDTVTITYMARRAYSEWPEKKFCNDTNSYFKCKHWEKMGMRKIGRMIKNDQAIVEAFKSFTHHEKNGKTIKVVFNDADFNKHKTFRDQIAMDLKTDILVGAHGAGLMHNIFMRERGALIELSVDGSGSQRHFHNLAHWAGKAYYNPQCSNPVDVQGVINVVKTAINNMNLESY